MGFRERDRLVPEPVRELIASHGRGRYEGPAGVRLVLVDGVAAGLWERRRRGKTDRARSPARPGRLGAAVPVQSSQREAERIGAFLGLEPVLGVALGLRAATSRRRSHAELRRPAGGGEILERARRRREARGRRAAGRPRLGAGASGSASGSARRLRLRLGARARLRLRRGSALGSGGPGAPPPRAAARPRGARCPRCPRASTRAFASSSAAVASRLLPSPPASAPARESTSSASERAVPSTVSASERAVPTHGLGLRAGVAEHRLGLRAGSGQDRLGLRAGCGAGRRLDGTLPPRLERRSGRAATDFGLGPGGGDDALGLGARLLPAAPGRARSRRDRRGGLFLDGRQARLRLAQRLGRLPRCSSSSCSACVQPPGAPLRGRA